MMAVLMIPVLLVSDVDFFGVVVVEVVVLLFLLVLLVLVLVLLRLQAKHVGEGGRGFTTGIGDCISFSFLIFFPAQVATIHDGSRAAYGQLVCRVVLII